MENYTFKMPDIGEGIVEAEVVKWYVAVGDMVKEDDTIADVMTDKATVEITSPVDGTVAVLGCNEGEDLAIGSDFVVFKQETPSSSSTNTNPESSAETPDCTQSVEEQAPQAKAQEIAAEPKPDAVHKPLASPSVRRRARKHGIALTDIAGHGPDHRILQSDIDAYLAKATPSTLSSSETDSRYRKREGSEQIKVKGLRKVIGERMQLAKQHIPHFSYIEEVDVTELEKLRAHLNHTKAAELPKLTILPFFIRAMINSISKNFAQMNAHYDDSDNAITRHHGLHIGIATQTPAGLMVPVIRHAETMDIWQLANEIKRIATGARNNSLSPQELSGSTITVTSLGPLGGIATTPVINRPEVAIVGPNKINDKLTLHDGQIINRKVMNISSSFDHRVLDGAEAAEFIQAIRAQLEFPATIFI